MSFSRIQLHLWCSTSDSLRPEPSFCFLASDLWNPVGKPMCSFPGHWERWNSERPALVSGNPHSSCTPTVTAVKTSRCPPFPQTIFYQRECLPCSSQKSPNVHRLLYLLVCIWDHPFQHSSPFWVGWYKSCLLWVNCKTVYYLEYN